MFLESYPVLRTKKENYILSLLKMFEHKSEDCDSFLRNSYSEQS